jgi:hypothetical protein
MEIIRRDFLWLSGLALAAPPAGNIVATQAHAQATPKLTQILRQDLEGQDIPCRRPSQALSSFQPAALRHGICTRVPRNCFT